MKRFHFKPSGAREGDLVMIEAETGQWVYHHDAQAEIEGLTQTIRGLEASWERLTQINRERDLTIARLRAELKKVTDELHYHFGETPTSEGPTDA